MMTASPASALLSSAASDVLRLDPAPQVLLLAAHMSCDSHTRRPDPMDYFTGLSDMRMQQYWLARAASVLTFLGIEQPERTSQTYGMQVWTSGAYQVVTDPATGLPLTFDSADEAWDAQWEMLWSTDKRRSRIAQSGHVTVRHEEQWLRLPIAPLDPAERRRV
jgi:hypothetical protein